MGLGKLLHSHAEQADGGGTIDRPRSYELVAAIGFAGRRRRAFTRLAALSGAGPGDAVLDVGCGTGYWTRILATAVGPRGHVTGIDLSAPMIDYARRRAPANCSYTLGDGQSLPFPDASFDVVVSSLAIHHMPASGRPGALREMARVLRPGGRLLVAEFRTPRNHALGHLVGLFSGPAMRHDPSAQLAELVTGAGFRIQARGPVPPMLYQIQAAAPAAP